MKTKLFVSCIVLCLASCSADLLASKFHDFLDDVLSTVNSDNRLLFYNLSTYETTLVEENDGWVSLRSGLLLNLSSWSRLGDSSVTCDDQHSVLAANISFQPLSFSYRYSVDNGTSLSAYRVLTGTIIDLSAQLHVRADLQSTSSARTTFQLMPTGKVTSVVPLGEQQLLEEVTRALGRALDEEVLPRLQDHAGDVIDAALTGGGLDASPSSCGSGVPTPSYGPASGPTTGAAFPGDAAPPASGVSAAADPTTARSDEEEARDWGSFTDGADDSASGDTELVNRFVDDLLNHVGGTFSASGLEPYRVPNSDEELYQESVGSVTMSGTVNGVLILSLGADPTVRRFVDSVSVTADVQLSGLSYEFNLKVNSVLPGECHGKGAGLAGKMTIVANVTNSSAATVTLERFELLRTVTLGFPVISTDNTTEELQLGIYDAISGVFNKKINPSFGEVATPMLIEALEGRELDVSEALAATTAAPTTVASTTTTSTTTAVSPTTASTTTAVTTATSTVSIGVVSTIPTTATRLSTSTAPYVTLTTTSTGVTAITSTASSAAPTSSSSSTVPSTSSDGTNHTGKPGSATSLDLRQAWIVVLTTNVALFLVTKNIL